MSLIDLDELALRCRDDAAKGCIREAVGCYKASAFRSCIVATWNAVVFDFLHKLRELELTGDKNATRHLKDYEAIRSAGKARITDAQKFEASVLDLAQADFELLTPLERSDLDRLYEDRHRCAHPSMQSLDDPYEPSAELARTHVRAAVEAMLSREPVQGKAAIKRIFDEIKSAYFPRDIAAARIVLEAGPLKRARRALVRDVFLGLTKDLLSERRSSNERGRQFAAVAAIVEMHGTIVNELLPKDLPSVMSTLREENLWKSLAYCRRVPGAWEAAGSAAHTKLISFVGKATGGSLRRGIAHALHIPDLRDRATSRIPDLSRSELADAVARAPMHVYVADAIRRLSEATTYDEAEVVAETILIPLVDELKSDDIENLVRTTVDSRQVREAWRIPGVLERVFDETTPHLQSTKPYWKSLRDSLKNNPEWKNYTGLATKIKAAEERTLVK